MNFLMCSGGKYVNVAHIARIEQSGKGDKHCYILYDLADVELGRTWSHCLDPSTAFAPPVKADPGWSVLVSKPGTAISAIVAYPILAWRIGPDYAVPVTFENLIGFEAMVIVTPKGHVYDPETNDWPTIFDYLVPDKPTSGKDHK